MEKVYCAIKAFGIVLILAIIGIMVITVKVTLEEKKEIEIIKKNFCERKEKEKVDITFKRTPWENGGTNDVVYKRITVYNKFTNEVIMKVEGVLRVYKFPQMGKKRKNKVIIVARTGMTNTKEVTFFEDEFNNYLEEQLSEDEIELPDDGSFYYKEENLIK